MLLNKSVNIRKLGNSLKKEFPSILFAFLYGSTAQNGCLKNASDIDVAVYLNKTLDIDLYARISEVVAKGIGNILEPDIGILNNADPIYRFEVLKGQLLFSRDMEFYYSFFSLTCREYESQMIDYEIQKNIA
ncbi:MAG: nucleotidyltransferase domain-containing protein [Verrucomicrobiota bacterium]|nr:nucleotidyltransferase domain-containing protein [Verrucomicrobiota bacterium]